jgi:hypothetical protein
LYLFNSDAITIVVVDCFTSVIGGFAIFSIIGYMSYMNNIPIEEIAEGIPDLNEKSLNDIHCLIKLFFKEELV